MCFPGKNNYLTHEIFSCYLNVKPISFRHRLISRFLYFFFVLALKTSTLSSYSFVEITERLLRPIIWRDMKKAVPLGARGSLLSCVLTYPHYPYESGRTSGTQATGTRADATFQNDTDRLSLGWFICEFVTECDPMKYININDTLCATQAVLKFKSKYKKVGVLVPTIYCGIRGLTSQANAFRRQRETFWWVITPNVKSRIQPHNCIGSTPTFFYF